MYSLSATVTELSPTLFGEWGLRRGAERRGEGRGEEETAEERTKMRGGEMSG